MVQRWRAAYGREGRGLAAVENAVLGRLSSARVRASSMAETFSRFGVRAGQIGRQ